MSWIATVNLQSDETDGATPASTSHRLDVISSVGSELARSARGEGVVILPAGWFDTGKERASERYTEIEGKVRERIVAAYPSDIDPVVCFGVDGASGKDEIASAVGRQGTLARGRRFHPTPGEAKAKRLVKAEGYLSLEGGLARTFEHGGRKYYMAVCYDIHGFPESTPPVSDLHLSAVVDLIHGFNRRGADSGVYYFARMCASASRKCGLPVFAAAVFKGGKPVGNWPAGILWNQGGEVIKKWKYADNPLRPRCRFTCSVDRDSACVAVFDLLASWG